MEEQEKCILRVDNITKTYPGVKALDNVSLEFRKGEVHALIGENGAGKSTMIKVIAGAVHADSGTITVNGKKYESMNVKQAKDCGIQVIYQEFANVRTLSAAENVFLGEKTSNGMFVNSKEQERRAKELFDSLGVDIDPKAIVGTMSPARQQIIEIAKAVSKNAKVIIMDEPTAPLTVSEVQLLFRIIRDLKDKGVTIIYISHRLEELFAIGDRISVMRDGQYVGTRNVNEVDQQQLISMMVGRELIQTCPPRNAEKGEEILRVEHLSGNGVTDVTFSLHRGEVLGFGGLVGAGRTELMQVIFGACPKDSGEIYINGQRVEINHPSQAIQNGIGLVPEDRKAQGAFLNQTIQWNSSINNIKNISKLSFVNESKEREIAQDYEQKFNIKTPSLKQLVVNLSGGNQQKVVLAKTMAANSEVIIFDEPTRGIDVGAKQEIYTLINELVEKGKAVLLVSSDMPELLGMCDRVLVMAEGRQAGIVDKKDFTQEHILTLASSQPEAV